MTNVLLIYIATETNRAFMALNFPEVQWKRSVRSPTHLIGDHHQSNFFPDLKRGKENDNVLARGK